MSQQTKQFSKDMTVGEILEIHPDANAVLAGYHLGGCSHCAINTEETLEQVCLGYGVDIEMILGSLNELLQ